MSRGGLHRTVACSSVVPLSSEHADTALVMFWNRAGLESTLFEKVCQSWRTMSSSMSPIELNMLE